MDDGNVKQSAVDLRDKAGEFAQEAKKQAAHAVDTAQTTAMNTLGDLESHIKHNPMQAALVAGGVGLLLGILLSR